MTIHCKLKTYHHWLEEKTGPPPYEDPLEVNSWTTYVQTSSTLLNKFTVYENEALSDRHRTALTKMFPLKNDE